MLPVLNIPTSPLSSRRYKGGTPPGTPLGASASSSPSTSTGHPGLPNGLLRMANMQQQSSNPVQPPPKIATKIVPKDLKSQLALSKIGLLDGGGGASGGFSKPPSIMAPGGRKPTLINMSLAQSVANAVKFPPLIPPHVVRATGKKVATSSSSTTGGVVKNKQSNNNQHQHQQQQQQQHQGKSPKQPPSSSSSKGCSPNSSRSSSRNSSLSPKEKTSKPKPGAVKRIKPNQPLVSWAARNGGMPKKCNGWSWVGEGFEQRVDLNVSLRYKSQERAGGQFNMLKNC